MEITWFTTLLLWIASLAGGIVNALAGGGTLLIFPAIMAAGLSALAANATNSAIVCLGFAGATYGLRKELRRNQGDLAIYLAICFGGGLLGGVLLLSLGDKFFLRIVPFLLLIACLLLAFQDSLRRFLFSNNRPPNPLSEKRIWSFLAVGVASVYGGYFGAGMSVILLAVLGLTREGSLQELNALKQPISLTANLAACMYFILRGQVDIPLALILGAGAIAGGYLGGKLAGKIRPSVFRWTVILLGFVITTGYFWKIYF
jgi:uncharacterized protein